MAAFGFRPSRLTNGSPWNGAVVRCSVLSAVGNVFIGDSVILAGTTVASPVDGAILNDLALATAGGRVYGVITGICPSGPGTPNLGITYGATGANREVWVAVADAATVFETTLDTAATVVGASIQGNMYDVTATAGSTTTGVSAHVLAVASASATSAGWMIIGVRNDPANLGGLTSGTTSVASTSASPTIFEVVCTEPQVAITQLGAGV